MTDLAKLRELLERATPNWAYDDVDGSLLMGGFEVLRFDDCDIDTREETGRINCELIASLRNSAEELIAAAERVKVLEAALREIEERADEPCSGIARQALGSAK